MNSISGSWCRGV